jgi:hypothetical protein
MLLDEAQTHVPCIRAVKASRRLRWCGRFALTRSVLSSCTPIYVYHAVNFNRLLHKVTLAQVLQFYSTINHSNNAHHLSSRLHRRTTGLSFTAPITITNLIH